MVPGRDNSRTVSDVGLETVLNMLRNRRHVFALIIVLITVVSVQGQRGLARPNDQAPQLKPVDPTKDFRADFIKASEDYEASLQKLLVQYESDVKKLTEHSANCKELYAEGIISRREYETTTSGITEAQVKVDELRKQIKAVEITIAEAGRQPRLDYLRDSNTEFSSQIAPAWTTGN